MHKVFIAVEIGNIEQRARVAAAGAVILADYDTRLLARANDEQIAALREAGLAVELADELDRLILSSVVIDTTVSAPPTLAREEGWATRAAPGEPIYWLVQFVGPYLPAWVEAMRATGATVVGPMPQSSLLVRMTAEQAQAVAAIPQVQWVGEYLPSYKIHPLLIGQAGPLPDVEFRRLVAPPPGVEARAAEPPLAVTIVLFEADALSAVVAQIEANAGVVRAAEAGTIICELPRANLGAVAALPAVAQIAPYEPTTPDMQAARGITGVQAAFDLHGLDGEGEVVGVADSGLDIGADTDQLHPDFRALDGSGGRVIGYNVGGRTDAATGLPVWDDPEGHGTHVAGTTAGNGRADSLRRRPSGVAYQARLVMQSLLDPALQFNIPANLNALYEPIYLTDGVRSHNNSWGAGNNAQYLARAYQIDDFIWRHPDMIIVRTMGNAAVDHNNLVGAATPDGIVDLGICRPEATCRNGISVGASENTKPGSTLTWGSGWPADFSVTPLRDDRVADNAEHIAAFSGRGPTSAASGGRIKPDVLAPGTSILAPLSGRWNSTTDPNFTQSANAWCDFSAGDRYVCMGGTSMAAPHVTGMCALIRQYLRRVHNFSDPFNPDLRRRRPSAALIKAFLIHGARQVAGQNAANAGTAPSNHQGWGRVDLRRSLFGHPAPTIAALDAAWLPRRTLWLDDPALVLNGLPAADPASRLAHEVRVRVADTSVPLRATLVWTDFPGPVAHPGTLVNQLQLSITAPDGFVHTVPAALLVNNVQQIDILTPTTVPAPAHPLQAGEYRIRVATNPGSIGSMPGSPQDFALVISGPISHSDHRSPGALRALPDLAFVDLEPTREGQARHDGLAPSPARTPLDIGSPDIWVSREQNSDPARAVARLEAGQRHYVYVRVRNLGFAPAENAEIHLYWGDPATPLVYPADWRTEGIEGDGFPGNMMIVTVPARGESVVGPFLWDVPRGHNLLTLLVRAVHEDDPIVNEGDIRWDNNLTRRDFYLQDNATQVPAEPSGWDRFVFWIISGFGSPRNIDAWLQLFYEDTRDGEVKPVPAGVTVEVFDYDPITGDDKMGEGHTVQVRGPDGQLTSALRLTFSTLESGERGPDIYCRVPRPAGPEFADFVANSFFASGAEAWSSRDVPTADGGFYLDDFDGDRIGIDTPVRMVIRPSGITIRARFETQSIITHEFEPLPEGVTVKVMDSRASAPQPTLATLTTNAQGEIHTVLARRDGYKPSIYFLIERADNAGLAPLIDYFAGQATWDSRTRGGEAVAADGSVRPITGHFQEWEQARLAPANEQLRFRLEAPGILMHLRFEYYDREERAFVPLPAGVEVEAWENAVGATNPLVTGVVGANGQVELSAPKGGRPRLNLYARVLMRRRLTAAPGALLPPVAEVHKGGNRLSWETRGRNAVDGTAGAFADVETVVGATGAPLVFRIGAPADTGNAGDGTDANAAPFVLKVIGEVHDWLRVRSGGDWSGIDPLRVHLVTSAADGSHFDASAGRINLNTAYTAPGSSQPEHWNRRAIIHQYAHLVLEQLYSDVLNLARPAATVANHRNFAANVERDERLALGEGWAEYLATRLLAPPTRPDATPTQTGWRGDDNDGADSSGEIVPVAVANALWLLDEQIVSRDHPNISDAVNQRRFQALIWNPLKSLQGDQARQVPYHLYRAIQAAALADADLILGQNLAYIRQEVRRLFEANGMVFTRGQITAAAQQGAPADHIWRFQVRPADRARLNVTTMGRITAYRMQAAPAGTTTFVNVGPVVEVPSASADQRAQVDVDLILERLAGVLAQGGNHDFRVQARDEFEAWDTFADDFTGNGGAIANSNDAWQRNRLHSIHSAAIAAPA